jgi:hypothetical protein
MLNRLNRLSGLKRVPGRRERGAYLTVIGVLTISLLAVMTAHRRLATEHWHQGRNLAMTDKMLGNMAGIAKQQWERAKVAEQRAEAAEQRAEAAERASRPQVIIAARPRVIHTFETDDAAQQEVHNE